MVTIPNDELLLNSFDKTEKLIFHHEVNVFDLINKMKTIDEREEIKHPFVKTFLNKNINESFVISLLKVFYEGALSAQNPEGLLIDLYLDTSDLKELKINFEIKNFYYKEINFETIEQRNSFLISQSKLTKTVIYKLIETLIKAESFEKNLDALNKAIIVNEILISIEENLDYENEKLKISIEDLDVLIMSRLFKTEAPLIAENHYIKKE